MNRPASVPFWYHQNTFKRLAATYREANGEVLLFVGSGLSRWAGLPDWLTLLRDLANQLPVKAQSDPSFDELQAILKAVGHENTAARASSFYRAGDLLKKLYNEPSRGRDSFRETLSKLLDRNTSEIHQVVATLQWNRLITTNYDSLFEKALETTGNPRSVTVTYVGDEKFYDVEQEDSPVLLKIHGDIRSPKSLIVIGQSDYEQLYEDEETYHLERTLGAILRRAKLVLFLGYSHDDHFVHKLIRRSFADFQKRNLYALVTRLVNIADFDAQIEKLGKELGLQFVTYSPESNHRELLEALRYLVDPAADEATFSSASHARRPTVVALYCGGTIGSAIKASHGADPEVLEVDIKYSRFDNDLNAFSKKLSRWYRNSYNSGTSIEPDILWEILDPEHQMLSENATVDTWNVVLRKLSSIYYKYVWGPLLVAGEPRITDPELKEIFALEAKQYALTNAGQDLTEMRFCSDFQGRYVLGIILLFGTDTLAFLASALALGIHGLPFPIVITGANQPPEEAEFQSRSRFYANSDAWSNMISSVYFLQSFGHRLTETFVCFAGTVHHGVNIRKRAHEIIPASRDFFAAHTVEPFVFRNLSETGQYMFRLVDGVFCNNYYASNSRSYAIHVGSDKESLEDLHHIRRHPFSEGAKAVEVERFASGVWYIEASPAFPDLNERLSHRGMVLPKLVLVEGFASGTYATRANTSFGKFLVACEAAGVPVVLISRYGILPTQGIYKVDATPAGAVQVLRLYGVVAETALPLLSLILARLEDRGYGFDKIRARGRRATEKKLDLLRNGLHDYFRERNNIITVELRDIADPRAMFHRAMLREKDRAISERDSAGNSGNGSKPVGLKESTRSVLVDLSRAHERVGAGPDGFLNVANIGFNIGRSFAEHHFAVESPATPRNSNYWEATEEEREVVFQNCEKCLESAKEYICSSWLDVEVIVSLIKPAIPKTIEAAFVSPDRCELELRFSVRRRPSDMSQDERYALTAFSKQEEEFFALLQRGAAEENFQHHIGSLNSFYANLLKETWGVSIQRFEWFVLGFFKGLFTTMIYELRISPLAEEVRSHKIPSALGTLRQAIRVLPLGSDDHWLRLALVHACGSNMLDTRVF